MQHVAIFELRFDVDSLTVDKCAIAASQIANPERLAVMPDLGVFFRDAAGRQAKGKVGMAADAKGPAIDRDELPIRRMVVDEPLQVPIHRTYQIRFHREIAL